MAESANTDDEFAGVPDMPSDESIRAEIIRTGGIEHWNPYGLEKREPTDFRKLPKDMADRVIQTRLAAGPGPTGNAYQNAVWEQHRKLAELDKEHDQIVAQLDEARGFDAATGKPIPMIGSPERRKALGYRLLAIADEQSRTENGRALEKGLAEAVTAEKRRIKEAYILSEAKRRAGVTMTEDKIDSLAEVYRKMASSR